MSGLREERGVPEMVKASIQVRSGTARFRVAVQAESMQRTLSLVGSRYPGRSCWVEFPIEPEGFFVEGHGARAGMVVQPEELAA
jgi:hypothetical protein